MPIPLKRPFPQPTPLILINLVYYITFNLKISASRQNIKNLISNFGAIYVGIMHDKFQASSFTGVGGEWGGRCTRDVTPDPYTKFLNSLLRFAYGRDNKKIKQNNDKTHPDQKLIFFQIIRFIE